MPPALIVVTLPADLRAIQIEVGRVDLSVRLTVSFDSPPIMLKSVPAPEIVRSELTMIVPLLLMTPAVPVNEGVDGQRIQAVVEGQRAASHRDAPPARCAAGPAVPAMMPGVLTSTVPRIDAPVRGNVERRAGARLISPLKASLIGTSMSSVALRVDVDDAVAGGDSVEIDAGVGAGGRDLQRRGGRIDHDPAVSVPSLLRSVVTAPGTSSRSMRPLPVIIPPTLFVRAPLSTSTTAVPAAGCELSRAAAAVDRQRVGVQAVGIAAKDRMELPASEIVVAPLTISSKSVVAPLSVLLMTSAPLVIVNELML